MTDRFFDAGKDWLWFEKLNIAEWSDFEKNLALHRFQCFC